MQSITVNYALSTPARDVCVSIFHIVKTKIGGRNLFHEFAKWTQTTRGDATSILREKIKFKIKTHNLTLPVGSHESCIRFGLIKYNLYHYTLLELRLNSKPFAVQMNFASATGECRAARRRNL